MPNQKKTGVWHHYIEIIEGRKRVGQCKYCGQTYANNATRMKRHLTICKNCPERIQSSYKKLLQLSAGTTSGKSLLQELIELGNSSETANLPNMKTESVELPALGKGEAAGPSFARSVTQEMPSVGSHSRQSDFLANFVDKMSKEDQERADETLARAIFASSTSLSIVENQYWKDLYKLIRPSYKLPSHYRLAHPLLDREYNRVQTMVAQRISRAESLTLMPKRWTDTQGNSLLSIMFATPEAIFLKAIATKPSHHTGEYIANILGEEIESAGPPRVQALVTDNTSSMRGAGEILKSTYPHLIVFVCSAHGLNLLAKDILSASTMKTILAAGKAIVKVFNNHPIANQALKKLQKEKQGKENALLLPSETRWSSAIKCLESLLHTMNCLQHASTEETVSQIIPQNIRKQILDDVFWVKVQDAYNLLLPISEATKKLEDAPILSYIPEMFRKLNENLIQLLPSSPLSKEEAEVIKQGFTKVSEICSHPVHLAANLLDPQHCGQHLSESDIATALDIIMELAKNIPNINERAVMADIAEYRAKEKLWSQDIVWRASEAVSPLTWWKGYCNTRQLSRIAVRIFSIPPTATSCERKWRTFDAIKTKKRNRLTNERTAKLVSVSLLLQQENQLQAQLVNRMKCDKLPIDSLQMKSLFGERERGSTSSESDSPPFGVEFTRSESASTDSETEGSPQ
ncbi:zinc finger BED domain-containing protein 4-like [Podarcis muralis]